MTYEELLRKEKIRYKKFNEAHTAQELMQFMDDEIKYGWVSNDMRMKIDTLHNIKNNYTINSLNLIFKSGLGTCLEQAKLIKYFFEKQGLETHLFCCKFKEENGAFFHCLVIYKINRKYYYFEHSTPKLKGIYSGNSIIELLKYYINNNGKNYNEEIIEIESIPDNISLDEFIEYVDLSQKKINCHMFNKR